MSLTPEQSKARLKGLGGSDVSVALGVNPWRTQLQLWAEKTGQSPGPSETPAMEWGSRLEGAVAQKYADDNPGFELIRSAPDALPIAHTDYECLQALPDGIIMRNGKPNAIWEGKTSSIDWPDGPPLYYIMQVQHYMYVTGLKRAIISCLFRGREYVEYEVVMDTEAYEKHVLPELLKFWTTVTEKLPIYEPNDLSELSWVQGGPPEDEEPLEATADLMHMVMEVQTADKIAKEAAGELKELKLGLAKAMGGAKSLVGQGGRKLVTQYATKDSVILDTKLLLTERPEMLEKYSKVKRGYRAMRIL